MEQDSLLTFEQATAKLGITESELDELIEGGKLTTRAYFGDVFLSAEEVLAHAADQARPIQPADPDRKLRHGDSRIARIQTLLAAGVREVRAAQASELLNVSRSRMSHLAREGRVNAERRGANNWYLVEDIEIYARLQSVWASKSGAWTPYGKLDADHSYLDLNLASPAKPRPTAFAMTGQSSEDYRLESTQAAEILGVCVRQCHRLAKRYGMKPEPMVRRLGDRDKWGRLVLHRFWSYSAREVYAMADRREQKRSRSSVSPEEWNERAMKPFIRTKIEAPPGDILITRVEAGAMLGISVGNVSRLVSEGRLFGWQAEPGKPGNPLYLSARQVARYREDPDRLKRRAAVNRGRRPPSPPGQETERELWLEEIGLTTALENARKSNAEREHGELFNTRQAAKLLGVSTQAVHGLRQRGRISGYQKANRKCDGGGNKWWFYRKDDVYNLLADSEYTGQRDRARAAKLRSMGRWVPERNPDW